MSRQYWKPGNMLYPVPAVMVTCQRPSEKPNIITAAWTGTVCSDPAMVYISLQKKRYSYDIIRQTGEFVINLTTKSLAKAADYCGVVSGRDVDKFAKTALTPCASKTVSCPGIAQSPVNMECRVTEIKNLGSHDMFLAAVECVAVEESLLDEKGRLHLDRCGLMAYAHGGYYEMGKLIGTFGYSVKKKPLRKNRKQTHK